MLCIIPSFRTAAFYNGYIQRGTVFFQYLHLQWVYIITNRIRLMVLLNRVVGMVSDVQFQKTFKRHAYQK